jgi:hypothetical protein
MAELHKGALDADQREALATVDRYSGDLRRQSAELKAEVTRLRGSLAAAEETIAKLQKVAQEVAPLEERLGAADNYVETLEAQVLAMHGQLLETIPESTDTRQAAQMLTKHTLGVMAEAFRGLTIPKTHEVAHHFALLLMLMVCQHVTGQDKIDKQLEDDIFSACHRFFHRVAPGRFTPTK